LLPLRIVARKDAGAEAYMDVPAAVRKGSNHPEPDRPSKTLSSTVSKC
jgi:hypothetical protein